jgi:hypothetical protein
MTETKGVCWPRIHNLWAEHVHACPYVKHAARGCYCTSPTLPGEVNSYAACDAVSLSLWCLTEEHYKRCPSWPAGDGREGEPSHEAL